MEFLSSLLPFLKEIFFSALFFFSPPKIVVFLFQNLYNLKLRRIVKVKNILSYRNFLSFFLLTRLPRNCVTTTTTRSNAIPLTIKRGEEKKKREKRRIRKKGDFRNIPTSWINQPSSEKNLLDTLSRWIINRQFRTPIVRFKTFAPYRTLIERYSIGR